MNTINFSKNNINSNFILNSLNEDGYVIIRDIFENELIDDLNNSISKIKQEDPYVSRKQFSIGNAFGKHEKFGSLLLNKKLNDVFKYGLKIKNIGFWGHSDILVNILSPWHKDDGGENPETNYFGFDSIKNEKAVIIKCAIYLQDHHNNDEGLWVIPKSHREYFPGKLDPINTKLKKNDLLLFDARLSHRGKQKVILPYYTKNKTIFKIANKFNSKFSTITSCFFNIIKTKFEKDRNAIFFTIASVNEISMVFGRRMAQASEKKGYSILKLNSKIKKNLEKNGFYIYP